MGARSARVRWSPSSFRSDLALVPALPSVQSKPVRGGKLLLLTSLVAGASPAAAQTKTLGLGEVVSTIRARSPALMAARSQIDVADAQVEMAWTGWQPKLDAIGQLTLSSVEAVLDPATFFPPGLAEQFMITPPEPTVIQPAVQLAGILQLQQTLFNITVLRAPAAAKAARAAAIADVSALEDELVFSGATLYVTLVGLVGLEEAAERAASVAEDRIQQAKIYVEAGTATPLSVTRAETDLAQVQGQRVAVQAQRQRLLSQLILLLGEDDSVQLKAEPVEAYLRDAAGDHLARRSVVAAKKKVEAATAQVGLHDMRWLPTVAAKGSLLYQNYEGFAGTPFLAQAVISLVIPLYDSGERYAATHIAQAQVTAAERGLDLAQRSARAFLQSAQADLLSSKSELELAQAQQKLATDSVQQAEDLAQGGLATPLELADADARRFSADRLVVQKKLALDLAQLRLHYAMGGQLADNE